jgi:deoxyribonuclease-4
MDIGIHISKGNYNDISDNIAHILAEYDLNICQIYTHGPNTRAPNKIDYKKLKLLSKNNIFVHTPYPFVDIWHINKITKNNSKSANSLFALKSQIMSCNKFNAVGMVLHIPPIYPNEAVETVKIIKPLFKKTKTKLLIEMISSKPHPDKTYETPEKIDNLTTLIGPNEYWWGWCIDTAHIWGAGVNIKSYSQMENWLNSVEYKKKILLFHLNGSSSKMGSGKDKHEIAFSSTDLIWKNVDPYKSGVYALIKFAKKYKIPIILEINRGSDHDMINLIKTCHKLYK